MRLRVLALTLTGVFLSLWCAFAQSDGKSFASDHQTDAKRTYHVLNQLTPAQRKLLFRNLPSDMKAALWVEHLESFLRNHPELNSNQRAIVNSAITLLDATLYDQPNNVPSPTRDQMSKLDTAARLAFSRDLLGEAFYDLSDVAVPATDTTESSGHAGTIMATDTDPVILDDCSCSHDSDWCSGTTRCSSWGCKPVTIGCGSLGWWPCDGYCNQ